MATYLYRREDGTEFDYQQPMDSPRLTECPQTGQPVKRIITGGHGAQLPRLKTVKYRDGNFVSSQMAKKLETNPFYTTIEDKRTKIQENTEKAKEKKANDLKKAFGRTTGLGRTGL